MHLVNFYGLCDSQQKYEKYLTSRKDLIVSSKNVVFLIAGFLKRKSFLLQLNFENKILKKSKFVVYCETKEKYEPDANMAHYFLGVTNAYDSQIADDINFMLAKKNIEHENQNFIEFLHDVQEIYLKKLLPILNSFGDIEELKQNIKHQVEYVT